MRRAALFVALSLFATGLLGAGAANAAPCGTDRYLVWTLHIKPGQIPKKAKRDSMVEVQAMVTRPGDEDPAGEGVDTPRPMEMPAEDVLVGFGGYAIAPNEDQYYMPGSYAHTGEDGSASLTLSVPDYVPRGSTAIVVFQAEKVVFDLLPCPQIYEYDRVVVPGAFTIR